MFPSDTDFDTKITLETDSVPIDEESPFRILFLGDWSGRESRSQNLDSADLRPIEIDRDNFDDVVRKLNIGLKLDFPDNGESFLSLEFAELEDFHPDRIFQRLAVFENLRDVRRKLLNKDSFNEAAKEVRSWLVNDDSETNEVKTERDSLERMQSAPDELLDQILGQTNEIASSSQKQNTETSELSTLIAKLVKPHLIKTDKEEQSKLLLIVDEVISDLMRKILHHPKFQALESAWRGMYMIVRRIETSIDLKIFLLDISKSELSDKLK